MTVAAPTPDPLQIAIQQLERDVSAAVAPGRKTWEEVCDTIDEAADKAVDQILSTIGSDENRITDLLKRVAHLRTLGAATGTSADENLIRTCQYLLGFTVAGLTFLLAFSQRIAALPMPIAKGLWALGLAFALVLLTSVVVLVLHTVQNRFRYPFLYFERIGNPWNWFYYGCISPETPRWPFEWPRQGRFDGAKFYALDLARFVSNAVRETKAAALRSDLQHFFLLMSYQGYALQFELRTQNIFIYGVGAALVGLVLLLIGIAVGWL